MKNCLPLLVKFNLTGFLGAKVIEVRDDDENLVEGVFIPIERNYLFRSKKSKNIYCSAFANPNKRDSFVSATHYMLQHLPQEGVAKLRELGYKSPRLGYIFVNYDAVHKNSTQNVISSIKK